MRSAEAIVQSLDEDEDGGEEGGGDDEIHQSETDELRAHGTGPFGDGAMETEDRDAVGTKAVGIAAMQGRSPAKRSGSTNANSGSKKQKTTVTT